MWMLYSVAGETRDCDCAYIIGKGQMSNFLVLTWNLIAVSQ